MTNMKSQSKKSIPKKEKELEILIKAELDTDKKIIFNKKEIRLDQKYYELEKKNNKIETKKANNPLEARMNINLKYIKNNSLEEENKLKKDLRKIKVEINKTKRKNIKNKIIQITQFNNNIINISYFIVILILINQVLLDNQLYLINLNFSKITLKINGSGNKYVLSESSYYFKIGYYPNITYINEERQPIVNNSYYFNQTNNKIELIWYNNNISCSFMFYKCSDIIEIDLSYFDSSQVIDMSGMFYYCSSLTLLNLENLNTSNVINMGSMFSHCSSITTFNLSNFDTSKVTNMKSMFSYCSKINSFNLKMFDTSNVNSMNSMFEGCSILSSLDLSNFNTSNLKDIGYMFFNCQKLSYLNLSSFDTSKVTNMGVMFYVCSKLSSLDIMNFDTSNVKLMNSMFKGCYILTSLNLSNFKTSNVTSMADMFETCSSLSSLDLSSFDTSNVINMDYMFNSCSKLISLNLSNFNTSQVKSMKEMFHNCHSLISLNIISFDTSKVTNMNSMFRDCNSLTILDLSSLDSSNVIDMAYMFYDCTKLNSLNLSSFNTLNVINMNSMFRHCPNLFSLNLSNFNTQNCTDISYMFFGCSALEYINLINFTENKLTACNDLFKNIPDNLVICINENNINNKILTELNKLNYYIIDCSNDWKSKKIKIVNKKGLCYDNNNIDILFKYEYNCKYYEHYINKNLTNNSTIKNCSCDLEKCLKCPKEPLKESLCVECNDNYYKKENDNFPYMNLYNKCYKEIKGYYLDQIVKLFIKCFFTCDTCELKGDNFTHNCLTCNKDYPYKINKNNYFNCYIENCSYYYYFDENNNFQCTLNYSCPYEYPYLIVDKSECVHENFIIENSEIINVVSTTIYESTNFISKIYLSTILDKEMPSTIIETEKSNKIFGIKEIIEDMIKYEKNDTIIKTKEDILERYKIFLKNIEEYFTDENYDTKDLDIGKNEFIETNKLRIIFTTTNNNKNKNLIDNFTTIDLGECDNSLRLFYNISKNEILYLKIINIKQDGMKIPKVEYNVYRKLLETNNLENLDLSICKNKKIFLFIPIIIKENLYLLNSSSKYYNDICNTTTSEYGTDISLKDRRIDFLENNKTICQDDCDFIDYDYNMNKAKCSCKNKEFNFSLFDMDINKTKLLKNFIDIKNVANLYILKCYKILFSKAGIIKNFGFYLILIILIIHIINIIIFYSKKSKELNDKIKDIIFAKMNMKLIKDNDKGYNNGLKNGENIIEKQEEDKSKDIINTENLDKISRKKTKKRRKKKKRNKEIDNHPRPIHTDFNNFDKINNNIIENNLIINFDDNKKSKNKNMITTNIINENVPSSKNKNIIEKAKKIMEFNNDEINDLSYDLALQYDNRTYCMYYISLLKMKHNLIFSFFYNNDYNYKIIKIDSFFIEFTITYTVNALFYNDNTMHNIYVNKGSFDIEYQIPKIIYSSLISYGLNTLFKILALSNDLIIEFKQNKEIINVVQSGANLRKKLNIKIWLYFILSSIILIFCWYYISMFCAIYGNTQYHLLKDVLINFGLDLISPLGICLLPVFFRIHSLINPKKRRVYLYKFSKFLQLF